MGTFRFAYRESGKPAFRKRYPLAKSMTGAGTRPAATAKAGDLAAYTTASALTTSSVPVVRMLLEEDETANYEDGSSLRVGILGIFDAQVETNSSGVATASASNGGVISKTGGMAGMNPRHTNGHSQQTIVVATADTVFEANLATAAASAAALSALKGTLAGLTFTNASGGSDYTVNTGESGEKQCLLIVDVDVNDTNLKRVHVKFRSSAGLTPVSGYLQYENAVPYTAQ